MIENEDALLGLMRLWGIRAALFTLGLCTSIAGYGSSVIMLYVLILDQQFYSNHHYLLVITVLLLTIANSGARFSLDAWNSDDTGPDRVPYWPVLLIKLQLTSVYLFASLSKINREFLDGVTLEMNWRASVLDLWGQYASLETPALLTIATELFLAFGFWLWRVRWVALLTGAFLHVSIVMTLGETIDTDLIAFGLVMFALYAPFFSDVILRLWPARETARVAAVSPPA
jgi:hypothetical protein